MDEMGAAEDCQGKVEFRNVGRSAEHQEGPRRSSGRYCELGTVDQTGALGRLCPHHLGRLGEVQAFLEREPREQWGCLAEHAGGAFRSRRADKAGGR